MLLFIIVIYYYYCCILLTQFLLSRPPWHLELHFWFALKQVHALLHLPVLQLHLRTPCPLPTERNFTASLTPIPSSFTFATEKPGKSDLSHMLNGNIVFSVPASQPSFSISFFRSRTTHIMFSGSEAPLSTPSTYYNIILIMFENDDKLKCWQRKNNMIVINR